MGTFRVARGKTYFRSPSLAVSAPAARKPGHASISSENPCVGSHVCVQSWVI